jgi:hypothetical protein
MDQDSNYDETHQESILDSKDDYDSTKETALTHSKKLIQIH